jgi:hypothetical protein
MEMPDTRLLRKKDRVDDVDHTVRRVDVGSEDPRMKTVSGEGPTDPDSDCRPGSTRLFEL